MNSDDRVTFIWLSVISLVLILAIPAVALLSGHNIDGLTAQQQRQCVATNVTRAQDNASHLADYQFDELQIKNTQASLQSNYAALRKIGLSKQILDRDLAQTQASLVSERADVTQKTWAALNNCTAPSTVGEVELFQISQKPPPSYATDLLNAAKPDPTGSIP